MSGPGSELARLVCSTACGVVRCVQEGMGVVHNLQIPDVMCLHSARCLHTFMELAREAYGVVADSIWQRVGVWWWVNAWVRLHQYVKGMHNICMGKEACGVGVDMMWHKMGAVERAYAWAGLVCLSKGQNLSMLVRSLAARGKQRKKQSWVVLLSPSVALQVLASLPNATQPEGEPHLLASSSTSQSI
eukprot:1160022-Pelagomonas_calceolata.AAC.7